MRITSFQRKIWTAEPPLALRLRERWIWLECSHRRCGPRQLRRPKGRTGPHDVPRQHRGCLGASGAFRGRGPVAHASRRTDDRPAGTVGPVGLRAVFDGMCPGHRRHQGTHGRRAWPTRRSGKSRPPGSEGVAWLGSEPQHGSLDAPADTARRWPPAGFLGRRTGTGCRAQCGHQGPVRRRRYRLLQLRATVPGGVLHALRHCGDRPGDESSRRQYPPLHGDGGRGPNRILRDGWRPGFLH